MDNNKISQDQKLIADRRLINMLRNGTDDEQKGAFRAIYLGNKEYCLSFMRSKFGDREEIKDIYQTAMIILREKVNNPAWGLTATLQTFLNSVSYYQGLTAFGKPRVALVPDDEIIEITEEYFPMEESLNSDRVRIMVAILKDENKTTATCRQILTRFWYNNQTLQQIAAAMGYKNSDGVKNQKSRCQAALKNEVLKKLKEN